MTKLTKEVVRETKAKRRTFPEWASKPLVIKIEPLEADPFCLVHVKEKGTQTWYTVTANQIYNLGAQNIAERIRRERDLKRKARSLVR